VRRLGREVRSWIGSDSDQRRESSCAYVRGEYRDSEDVGAASAHAGVREHEDHYHPNQAHARADDVNHASAHANGPVTGEHGRARDLP